MDWQPIETAPKDGTNVLLWEKYSITPFVGYWLSCGNSGFWYADLEHVDAEGGWDGAIAVSKVDQEFVSHWMPLPPPPKEPTP
jgi:hypothetical protein